jgi:flagellar basal-body rod protein FlgB
VPKAPFRAASRQWCLTPFTGRVGAMQDGMMFIDVVNSGSIPALEKMLAFTQANHRVLAENVANADTPEYKTRHLDPKQFQADLGEAIATRKETRSQNLVMPRSKQYRVDEAGRLAFEPLTRPAENILFHDGTNARIEEQMSQMAENAMMHQTIVELLKGRFDGLRKAISGNAT